MLYMYARATDVHGKRFFSRIESGLERPNLSRHSHAFSASSAANRDMVCDMESGSERVWRLPV